MWRGPHERSFKSYSGTSPGTSKSPSTPRRRRQWHGARVRAYDPAAAAATARHFGAHPGLTLCARRDDTLIDVDALIVVTEWNEFRSPDFRSLKTQLRTPVIFDGRNLYDPGYLEGLGFMYYGIGRGRGPEYG